MRLLSDPLGADLTLGFVFFSFFSFSSVVLLLLFFFFLFPQLKLIFCLPPYRATFWSATLPLRSAGQREGVCNIAAEAAGVTERV